MEFFTGGMILFGSNFAPRNWAFCDGQLIAISTNTALYSLLGSIWGGDGRTTFALPDLRGRAAIGMGQGPGLSARNLAQPVGTEFTQLDLTHMPTHNHLATFTGTSATSTLKAATSDGDSAAPREGDYLAVSTPPSGTGPDKPEQIYLGAADVTTTVNLGGLEASVGGSVTVASAGGGQQFTNMQPSLGSNYIICLQGVFPSRS